MLGFIKERLLVPDCNSGTLPREPQVDTVKEFYGPLLAERLVTEDEWVGLCECIYEMQERDSKFQEPSILARILSKYGRFPTVGRVRDAFGADRADRYKTALETIETYGCSEFPDERCEKKWSAADLDVAVSVVTDVIAPHLGDEGGMSVALSTLAERAREKGEEKKKTKPANDKKAMARSLGIWLPVYGDIDRWRTDLRTRDAMPVFLPVVDEVIKRMKLARSYFQYIPRRRICDKTVADFPANLERMKAYLRGVARASRFKKNNGCKK